MSVMRSKLDYRQVWNRLARARHRPVMEDMLHIRRHRGKRITRRWRKMNHIYKVVWSKVRGCYVVVAEIARSNGKTRSQKVVAVLGTALISSMLFTGGGLLTAEAASQTIGGYIFDDTAVSIATSGSTVSTTSGSNTIALGSKTTATGANAVALGEQNKATGDNAIAFGGGYMKGIKSNTASGTASVAFGEGSQAISEGSVAFGYNTPGRQH